MNINQHPFFKVLDKLNFDLFNQIMNSPINDITELYKDINGNILFKIRQASSDPPVDASTLNNIPRLIPTTIPPAIADNKTSLVVL